MTGKHIYKIENLKNGKIYIGQSVQPNTRWKQHQRNKYSVIGTSILEEGVENFSFEIIEFAEDYTERENYWIDYHDSISTGYNQNYATFCPITIKNNLLDIAVVRGIEEDLLTAMTYSEIMNKYSCASESITKINRGEHIHSILSAEYPISNRANQNKYNEDFIREIVYDLQFTELSIAQVADKYGISNKDRVSKINLGKQAKSPKEFKYPIRVKNFSKGKLSLAQVWEIEEILIDSSTSYHFLGQKYEVHHRTIQAINAGNYKGSYVMNSSYPLRETCND